MSDIKTITEGMLGSIVGLKIVENPFLPDDLIMVPSSIAAMLRGDDVPIDKDPKTFKPLKLEDGS